MANLADCALWPILPDRLASEVLAERWTPIIVRELLIGGSA